MGKKGTTTEKVINYFQNTTCYLKDNCNIKMRAEIIKGFLGDCHFNSILDIACGSGEISIPFLNDKSKLTLIDISDNMLSIAFNKIPDEYKKNATIIHDDILTANLSVNTYNLIICTGLLAHVEDPIATIQKMISLSKSGGSIILQNTNSRHVYSYLNILYRFIGTLINRNKYNYNHISEKTILSIFKNNNFKLVRKFSYIQSFMFLDRILKAKTKYNVIKKIFGCPDNNLRASLGNDCIYYFKKEMRAE
jgi:ubiquinone/menaquinone biosynthesis C-methylase UbiE